MPLEDAGRDERAFLLGIATALTAMGGMALVLSIVGIYALLSFMVTRRTREIGIRVALGATSWQVLRRSRAARSIYLRSAACSAALLGIVFVQMRAMILISSPGAWFLDAGDDLPDAGDCRAVSRAGCRRAARSAFGRRKR